MRNFVDIDVRVSVVRNERLYYMLALNVLNVPDGISSCPRFDEISFPSDYSSYVITQVQEQHIICSCRTLEESCFTNLLIGVVAVGTLQRDFQDRHAKCWRIGNRPWRWDYSA